MSNALVEKSNRECMQAIVEAEEKQKLNLFNLFRSRDYLDNREISYGNFERCLEKVLPSITKEGVKALFQQYQKTGQDKINYEVFLRALNQERQKKNFPKEFFNQILKKFASYEPSPAQIFQILDSEQTGKLTKSNLGLVLENLEINYEQDELDDLFDFIDSNEDNNISEKEFVDFYQEMNALADSSEKDIKTYWEKTIFIEMHKRLTQRYKSLMEFFGPYGLQRDLTMPRSAFTKAMEALVENLEVKGRANFIKLMLIENDDNNVSIRKLMDTYDSVVAETHQVRQTATPSKNDPRNLTHEEQNELGPFFRELDYVLNRVNPQLRDIFNRLDRDRTGLIRIEEFVDVLRNHRVSISSRQADLLLKIHGHSSGRGLNYTEILNAAQPRQFESARDSGYGRAQNQSDWKGETDRRIQECMNMINQLGNHLNDMDRRQSRTLEMLIGLIKNKQ